MRFYKRNPIDSLNPQNDNLVVEADGRINTDSKKSLQIPAGETEDRPLEGVNGMIRYNQNIGIGGDFEAYINGQWTLLRNGRQNTITQDTFTNGDYTDTIFGPLSYDIDISRPQNVMVYVDNVYQIPTTNYTLTRSTDAQPLTTSTTVAQPAAFGETIIFLNDISNFNVGLILDGTNLTNNVIVATSATDNSIEISPGALGFIPEGGLAIAKFSTGTYIVFSEDAVPAPSKPVTALLGFDGYGPPFAPPAAP
jgi:hypothetical protein